MKPPCFGEACYTAKGSQYRGPCSLALGGPALPRKSLLLPPPAGPPVPGSSRSSAAVVEHRLVLSSRHSGLRPDPLLRGSPWTPLVLPSNQPRWCARLVFFLVPGIMESKHLLTVCLPVKNPEQGSSCLIHCCILGPNICAWQESKDHWRTGRLVAECTDERKDLAWSSLPRRTGDSSFLPLSYTSCALSFFF